MVSVSPDVDREGVVARLFDRLVESGLAKVSRLSAILPLAQATRSGLRTVLWGQVRPGRGTQSYELQQFRYGGWRSVGGLQTTTSRGFLSRTVRAGAGAMFRLWYPAEGIASPVLRVS